MILTLTPNGNGGFSQHTRGPDASGTNYGNCQTDDGDLSYCYSLSDRSGGPKPAQDCYAFTDPGAGYGFQGINSITLNYKVRVPVLTGSAILEPLLRISSTLYLGGDINISNSSYELQSYTWNTNPATGQAWTWAQIAALQGGFKTLISDDTITQSEVRITFVGADVDFKKSFLPDTVPTVIVSPQQPTFTPPNYFSFIPNGPCPVSVAPQQPIFTPANYFGFTPTSTPSEAVTVVQPTFSFGDVALPRTNSLAIGGGKFRGGGTLRSPARHVVAVGAESPGIGLALLGAADTFTGASHTYTATMKTKATANAAATTVFSGRSCIWFKRDYDNSAVIYLGLQTGDVDTAGEYMLQFKAVKSSDGTIDYIGRVEIEMRDDI